jgi:glycosyltransferase involved in cell wall biosynthesis
MTRHSPSIAVLIPLYNHARYIGDTLASVLAQTQPADEIILIDDGSQDGGLDLAERILADLPYARCFRQPNAGAHVTLNRAVEASRSDYLAVLNSDDLFSRGKLARCRSLLSEAPETQLLCGRIGLIDGNGAPLRQGPAVDWLMRAEAFHRETGLTQLALLHENFVATTSNMVFSRQLWRDAGGFAHLRYCHDLDFLMTAFGLGQVRIDSELQHISYRVHAANTIGEDISRVRVEIAAVMAACLVGVGANRLLEGPATQARLTAFQRVLATKGMTGLVSYLAALVGDFPNRHAFYTSLADTSLRDLLRSFV